MESLPHEDVRRLGAIMNEAFIGSEAIIGFAGVIVGSAITIAKDMWVGWKERSREGSYSAMRLICILDEYADLCIDVVADDGTAQGRPAGTTQEGQEFHEAQVSAPEPLQFPDDIAWRSLPERLMHRTLSLPNTARIKNRTIAAASEYSFAPDYREYFRSRQRGYTELAMEALNISESLRNYFSISKGVYPEHQSDWEPRKYLKERLEEFEAADREAEQRARNRASGGLCD